MRQFASSVTFNSGPHLINHIRLNHSWCASMRTEGLKRKLFWWREPVRHGKPNWFMAVTGCNGKGVLMPSGTVKWFDAKKGFGFIEPSDGSAYAFVNRDAIEHSGLRALIDGQKVQYDIVPGMDGKAAAENLVILD